MLNGLNCNLKARWLPIKGPLAGYAIVEIKAGCPWQGLNPRKALPLLAYGTVCDV